MDVNVINSFLVAAYDILDKELGASAEKGTISLHEGSFDTSEFTIRIGVKGQHEGFIWYTMTEETALAMAGKMMETTLTAMDDMAESALGELANMMSGLASMLLEKAAIGCTLESPIIIKGKMSCFLSDAPALDIPLSVSTPFGHLDIKVYLKKSAR